MGTRSKEERNPKDLLKESMGKKSVGLIPKGQARRATIEDDGILNHAPVQRRPYSPDASSSQDHGHPSDETLQKAIHALSRNTFVAIVTSPVLALLTPLLVRFFNTPTASQEALRQTVL